MGKKNKGFMKQNRLFLIIVALILALIGSLVSVHYLTSQTDDGNPDITDETDDGDNEDNDNSNTVKIPEITSFDAADKKDVVSLSWTIRDSSKMVKSVQLFVNDKYVADVAGYSAWSLNKTTYNLMSGDVEFALVVTYENDGSKKLEEKTSLSIHPAIESDIKIERKGYDYTVTIIYSGVTAGTNTPSIYIAGISPSLFSVDTGATTTTDGKISTSYIVHLDPSVAPGTQLTGRFIFGGTDVKDFVITVEADGEAHVPN